LAARGATSTADLDVGLEVGDDAVADGEAGELRAAVDAEEQDELLVVA